VRLVRPDEQAQRVIALFQGSRAASPAAALSAWKRATGGSLGKGTEAAIALFNPESARELRSLDSVLLSFAFAEETGSLRWIAIAPRDDGTLAAAVTALALTDGRSEQPLPDGVAVDRLGPPGSFLIAHATPRLVAAKSRDELSMGCRLAEPHDRMAALAQGFVVSLHPEQLGGSGAALERRRVFAGLKGLGCDHVLATAGVEGESLAIKITSRFGQSRPALSDRRIDPDWLAGLPAGEKSLVFALALDPRPESWNRVFDICDRVEKADPSRAKVAPTRVRLNLLAAGAGIWPDVDLWPRLQGVSGGLICSELAEADAGWLALHTVDEASAEKIATDVLPRFARMLRIDASKVGQPTDRRCLGRLAGRALFVERQHTRVWLAWGERALSTADGATPPEFGRILLSAQSITSGPARFAVAWPARLPGVPASFGKPLSSLREPLVWTGSNDGLVARDEIRVSGMQAAVKAFLEGLLLE
jgi:hypothetical protein